MFNQNLRLYLSILNFFVVCLIHQVDAADEEMVDLVEMEVVELLTEMGFDGPNVPIIKGSALCAVEDKNPEIGQSLAQPHHYSSQ